MGLTTAIFYLYMFSLPLGCLRSLNKPATPCLSLSLCPRGSKEAELGVVVLGAGKIRKSNDKAEREV